MKQFQRPEAFPDSSLDRVLKSLAVNAGDFKFTQNVVNKDPMRKDALDSLIRQAIEAETLKSLNEKETEKIKKELWRHYVKSNGASSASKARKRSQRP